MVNYSFPFFHEVKFIFSSTLGEKAFRSCPSHCTPDGKTKVFPIIKDEARSLILVGVIILVELVAFFVLKPVGRISNPCSTVACSTPKGGALHSERHTFRFWIPTNERMCALSNFPLGLNMYSTSYFSVVVAKNWKFGFMAYDMSTQDLFPLQQQLITKAE